MADPPPSGAPYLGIEGKRRTGSSFACSFRGFEHRDDALAGGGADADRAATRAAFVQCLGEAGDDASPGRRKGVSGGERAAVDVELLAVDRAECLLATEAVAAERRVFPGAQRAEHL